MPMGSGISDAAVVEQRFLDVICDDPDLLRAEFDAIVAGEWPEPPVPTPRREPAYGRPRRGGRGMRWRAARIGAEMRDFGGQTWRRQRSPPPVGAAPSAPGGGPPSC